MRISVRSRHAFSVVAASVCLAMPVVLEADVTKITMKSRKPAFNNQSFGTVGPYEEIKGIAVGQIDPSDPRNAVITDIKFAPKNANGRVEYRTTFTILKAVDMSKAPGVLFYNVVNRANRGGTGTFHVGGDPGDGFLYRLGHVVLWSGWQGDLPISIDLDGRSKPAGRH